jgi:hypothetical protein
MKTVHREGEREESSSSSTLVELIPRLNAKWMLCLPKS